MIHINRMFTMGFVVLLTLGLLYPGPGRADQKAPGPLSLAVDFTYSSLYYWRGVPGGTGSFAMPSVDVSFSTEPLTVGANVWYAQGFEGDADERNDNSEIDYTLYASMALGPVEISAGLIDYTLPAGTPFADGHVLEANAGLSLTSFPLDNSLALFVNVAGDEDHSIFIVPSVRYTHEAWGLGLSLGFVASESAYYNTEGAALIDITPSVSYSIPVGDAEASWSLSVGYNPETGLKMPFLTLSTGFSL